VVDRRFSLAAVASGLVIVAIGCGGSGAPSPESPIERQKSATHRHQPAPVERGAEPRTGRAHAPDAAVEVQYSDAPPVELEHPPRAALASDRMESQAVGSTPVEIREDRAMAPLIREPNRPPAQAPISAAIIRLYFAYRFLYETWYPYVRDIDVHDRFASIVTWHLKGSGAPKQARSICDAALSLQHLQRVSVKFGSRSVDCFSASAK
jgi:hypothetical protein